MNKVEKFLFRSFHEYISFFMLNAYREKHRKIKMELKRKQKHGKAGKYEGEREKLCSLQ